MYLHRNEDIVNSGPGFQEKKEVNFAPDTCVVGKRQKRKPDRVENVLPARDRKKIQYGLLAEFKGMDLVEFSKWVLSATPAERERMLENFKKRKQRPIEVG